jgi:ornithine--oxo-acid transaminase
MTQTHASRTGDLIALGDRYGAHNYHPLPIVVAEAEGAWVTDVEGRRYLDLLAGYSALNFGHRHPRLVAAAKRQLDRVTLTSRAFHNDQLAPFCAELAELCGTEMVLPMNTGAEAVETAIKTARKWAYQVKGIPDGEATVVVAHGNFHGRTITIVSFSDDPEARADYGPFTPGFVSVPYGNVAALEAVVDDRTAAVLVEPVQGESGVIVPPQGYLAGVRRVCDEHEALMIADEIQSGLGRTGTTFACELEHVVPDVYVLGKALGGGILPVSAVVSRRDVLGVFRPGEHGSTFGGNPLAAAVGREVVAMLSTGEWQARAAALGERLAARLASLPTGAVTQIRVRGLWAGIDLDPAAGTGREVCERLMALGALAKDTHTQTIRLAPPLVIEPDELDWAVDSLAEAITG